MSSVSFRVLSLVHLLEQALLFSVLAVQLEAAYDKLLSTETKFLIRCYVLIICLMNSLHTLALPC